MKILSIGNSFSTDSHKWLHKLASLNGVNLYTANLFIGGCSLEMHWENIESNNVFYNYDINGGEGGPLISIEDALKADNWDIITIQQVSGLSGVYETYQPYLSNIVEVVQEHRPNAKLYFHQTWAYETDSQHTDFPRYDSDQVKMYKSIVTAAKKAAEEIGCELIPTGTVIQRVRESVPEFDYINGGISLCRDGFHLTCDYGRFLAAAVWLRTLTGIKVKADKFEGFDKTLIEKLLNVVNADF